MNKLSEEEKKRRKKESQAKYRARHPERCKESQAKWKTKNPDYYKEYFAVYNQDNKEKKLEIQAKWRETPIGRANYIVNRYRQSDEKYNRGKCTLTAQWIVENIFNEPCHYCGAMGWDVIGCDRIDNSLPHTPENVVPCCFECNCKRHTKSYEEFKKEMEDISPMSS